MRKRFLGILLSLVMVFSLILPANADAATDSAGTLAISIQADKAEARPGDTVHYTLSIGAVANLTYIELWLDIPEGMSYVPKAEAVLEEENEAIATILKTMAMAEFIESDLKFTAAGCKYNSTSELTLISFDCKIADDYAGDIMVTLQSGPGKRYAGYSDSAGQHDYELNVSAQTVTVREPVTDVTVTPATATLKDTGETVDLSAVIVPENATNKNVTYSTSDRTVATVNENGVVTAVAVGTAVITATTEDGGFTDSCTVSVVHAPALVAEKDSTCKVQGNQAYYQCAGCGLCFKDSACTTATTAAAELKPLLDHHYDAQVWEKDEQQHWHFCTICNEEKESFAHAGGTATCKELAKCATCGQAYGTYASHTTEKQAAHSATHFAPGNIEYWKCSVCEKLFSDEEATRPITLEETVIAQIEHSFSTDWLNDADKHWKQCGCGAIAEEAEHEFIWKTDLDATEETTGLKHQECSVCHYEKAGTAGTVIPVLPHVLTRVNAKAATCKSEGNLEYWTCQNCSRYFKDADGNETYESADAVVIPKLAHQYDNTSWEKDANNHWHFCTMCREEKETFAHSGGTATCKKLAECEVCGAEYGVFAPHVTVCHEAIEADHSHAGNIRYWECSVCGKLFSDAEATSPLTAAETVIPQIPHSYGVDWLKDTTKHWKECGCGAVAEEGIHVYEWIVDTPATEEATGLKHQACETCGYVLESSIETVIPKLEHELTKVDAVAATCKAAGNVEYWTCKNCDRYFKDADAAEAFDSADDVILAQLDHKYDADKWEADASEHWHVCELCQEEKSSVAEHTYGDWKVTKEATTLEKGSRERECSSCKYKQTEDIELATISVSENGSIVVENGLEAISAAAAGSELIQTALARLDQLTELFEEVTGRKTSSGKAPVVVAAAEISLKGNITMPAEGIDVTLQVPGVKKGDTCYFLLHLKKDGKWEEVKAAAGDGTLTGHFDSLSPVYVIKAEDTTAAPAPGEAGDKDPTDKPGESDTPGGADQPGGSDKPSGSDTPSGSDKPSGSDTPGGSDAAAAPSKTGDIDIWGVLAMLMAGFAMVGTVLFVQKRRKI